MSSKKRVLLSAFACDPYFGSDEEVGWQWARQLSERGFEVTVLTRRTHRQEIERGIVELNQCGSVKFEYVDIEWLYPLLSRINRRNHIYYYFWQWVAYKAAVKLHAQLPFELIHHVTWVSFRQPSFMGKIGAPFVFGPVAGGDEIPRGYTAGFSIKQRIAENVRHLANSIVKYDPLMRWTYSRATQIFLTSVGHLDKIPPEGRHKTRIELAIGCDAPPAAPETASKAKAGTRLLFAGRLIGLKGMNLGLQIFARVLQQNKDARLSIIGDGVDRERLEELAHSLGISHAIEWLGWLPKAEVIASYADYDALFYPSLRDSGGFVVLEALQQGLPVACFKLGGPGLVVDDTCGVAVEARSDLPATLDGYSAAVLRLLERTKADPTLSTACRARSQKFTWNALIHRIYGA
jgi:glycosyltransferase involved in cell wall biosynthesis